MKPNRQGHPPQLQICATISGPPDHSARGPCPDVTIFMVGEVIKIAPSACAEKQRFSV
jgi:hypothetical protein